MKTTILMVGLNHATAPIQLREQVASAECMHEEAEHSLSLLDPSLFSEVLVLFTCNRTELYTVTADRTRGEPVLREAFRAHVLFPDSDPGPLYSYVDREAAAHLFAVASGIDSMLLGEFEILGQVRDAYRRAAQNRSLGPLLHQLFQQAVRTGKRARAETAIGAGATSVASAAVALARRRLGTLAGRTALVVGAGAMGRRAARNLVEDGARAVTVVSRNFEHAKAVAGALGSTAISFAQVPAALLEVDLVISATKAPHLILDAPMLRGTMTERAGRPLCLIDIAVPRDIDPAAAEIENVTLYNIDALQELVAANRAARETAIEQVRALVDAEADAFWAWCQARRAAPLLSRLDARAEAIRQAELDKTWRRLDHLNLNASDRAAIAALSSGIVKKLLAGPRTTLKAAVQSGDGQLYLDLLNELFGLEQAE